MMADDNELKVIELELIGNHFYFFLAARAFHKAVAKRHGGEDKARRLINEAIAPLGRRRRQEYNQWELLSRYDRMRPKPNVNLLAMQVHAEEAGDGDDRRTVESIERQISRAIAARKAAQKRGKWRGPPFRDDTKK
jgi:hypothetical protein